MLKGVNKSNVAKLSERMVTNMKSHLHDQNEAEQHHHHFDSRTPHHSSPPKEKGVGKSGDEKLRSKHSETEQRRRSKINQRFQILRDLIPESDQKRDKATFLLEVIQYINFLKEKLEIYEGTYQGQSTEISKLLPWRSNYHPVESFVEQSPLSKDGFNEEDNVAVGPTLLSNVQNSVESCLSDEAVYKLMDHHHSSVDHAIAANMPLQPNMFVDSSGQPHESFPVADNVNEHSGFSYVPSKWTNTTNSCTSNDLENTSNSLEPSISNAYSERLVNNLTRALQSSGVDLSQANISVQLDVGKRENPRSTVATSSTNDQPGVQPISQYTTSRENYDHSNKRLRTEES